MTVTPGHYRACMKPDQTTHITSREREILYLMAAGLSRRAVAGVLCLSMNTIGTDLSRLYLRWQTPRLETAIVRAIVGGIFTMAELQQADTIARRRGGA